VRIGYSLNLEQTQKLIMTPELRQAIAILQLSAQELSTFVDEQLSENPLLEVDAPEAVEEPAAVEPEFDWQEYFHEYEDKPVRAEQQDYEDRPRFEPFVAAAPTLSEYLLEQLHMQRLAKDCLRLAAYIVGNLDEHGYLTLSVEEIAREQKSPLAQVEAALAVVQSLDPPGVGARNLEECLRLQIHLIPDCPPEMTQFLAHLEDLGAGRLQKIANALKVSLTRVQYLADLLRTLEPKPGRRFPEASDVRYIIPDVVVEEIDGEYIILVNDVSVPRLRVNQAYLKVLNQEEGTEARRFVETKLNAAAWLIRSIEQRRLTLYKVANAVVRRQEPFLRHGIKYLKPLTLHDIAEEIGVHESTVSRATANKYVQTPRGIFEFKFFFSTGLGKANAVTPETIKQALRDIVAGEDTTAPYADQKIAEILKTRGMEISRRTVAKYRDQLGIPPVSVRKRYD